MRSAGLIAALTVVSRVLGVARDAACASVFGAGQVWDAFSFAFRIPNLLRRLLGEGALTAAFVPELSDYLEHRSEEEARQLTGRVAGASLAVLVGAVLLGEAVVLGMRLTTGPGGRWTLPLALTALMLPYGVLICLTALAGAVLNGLKHFAAPALAPVVLNVIWIAAVLASVPLLPGSPQRQVFLVAAGILVAGWAQLALQFVAMRRLGFPWRPVFDLLHPEVWRVARTMAPVVFGMAAVQINTVLDGVIAISLAGHPGAESFRVMGVALPYPLEVGANSVLYYANRLMQLPLGVFGIALATAAFPTLSRQASRGDWGGFSESVRRGLGTALFVTLPAGVGLVVLSRPIVEVLFERGAFTAGITARTAAALACYSAGIWAYCAVHVLSRAFYGLKQAGTPARVAAAMVALNVGLNLALVWPFREAGLAAATALAATVQVGLLLWLLGRRVPLSGMRALASSAANTTAATAAMAAVAWGTLHLLGSGQPGLVWRVVRAGVPIGTGTAAYVAASLALGSDELTVLWHQLKQPADESGG